MRRLATITVLTLIAFCVGDLTASAKDGVTHSATIKWKPQKVGKGKKSEAERISKYVIYRANGLRDSDGKDRCESTFQPVGEVDGETTSYTDRNVKADQIYCYKVTAKRAHLESAASPVSIAVIPPDKSK